MPGGRVVGICSPLGSGNGSCRVVDPPPLVTTTGPVPEVPPVPLPPVPLAGLTPVLVPVAGLAVMGVALPVGVLASNGPSGFSFSTVSAAVAINSGSGSGELCAA